jgi:myosin-5
MLCCVTLCRTPYSQQAIVHLGDIVFDSSSNQHGQDTSSVQGIGNGTGMAERNLQCLAALLGVKQDLLQDKLCERSMQAGTGHRTSIHTVPLNNTESSENRHACSKLLYATLFRWLVGCCTCNSTHASADSEKDELASEKSYVGILDVFGFEILGANSFEQLCINYANEVLQNIFNHACLAEELRLYQEAGLDVSNMQWKDNSDVLQLLAGASGRPSHAPGLLLLLDSQTKQAGGSDRGFVFEAKQKHGPPIGSKEDKASAKATAHSSTHLFSSPIIDGDRLFVVRHYAAAVTYTADGIVMKNKEVVSNDLLDMLDGSSNAFLVKLLESYAETTVIGEAKAHNKDELAAQLAQIKFNNGDGAAAKVSAAPKRRASKSRRGSGFATLREGGVSKKGSNWLSNDTVATQFRSQMSALTSQLARTKCHFVRCIKPNNSTLPDKFDPTLILQQLQYMGVVDFIKIRKEGYPVRRNFMAFAREYDQLARVLVGCTHADRDKDPKSVCEKVLLATLGPQAAKTEEAKRTVSTEASVYDTDEDEDEQEPVRHKPLWQLGNDLVFLVHGQIEKLDQIVNQTAFTSAAKIQKIARGFTARKEYKQKVETARKEMAAREAAEKAKREAEEAQREAEVKAKDDAEEKVRQEEEEKVRKQEEDEVKKVAEEKAQRMAEEERQRAEEVQCLAEKHSASCIQKNVRFQIVLKNARKASAKATTIGALFRGVLSRQKTLTMMLNLACDSNLFKRSVKGKFGFNWKLRHFQMKIVSKDGVRYSQLLYGKEKKGGEKSKGGILLVEGSFVRILSAEVSNWVRQSPHNTLIGQS